jgi:hypothetical protein
MRLSHPVLSSGLRLPLPGMAHSTFAFAGVILAFWVWLSMRVFMLLCVRTHVVPLAHIFLVCAGCLKHAFPSHSQVSLMTGDNYSMWLSRTWLAVLETAHSLMWVFCLACLFMPGSQSSGSSSKRLFRQAAPLLLWLCRSPGSIMRLNLKRLYYLCGSVAHLALDLKRLNLSCGSISCDSIL